MAQFLIFDSEFTDNTGELLELSIFDIAGAEVYHSYFKPRKAKKWMLHPHNITPEMVADKPAFDQELAKLQPLFDQATHLAGFEVESDLEHLHEEGLQGLFLKQPVELRDLFWLVRGRKEGYGLYNIPGLEKCAAALGIEFDENGAHSASGDTKVTWQLMIKLLQEAGNTDLQLDAEAAARIWNQAKELIIDERQRLAHGFVTLLKEGTYYRISGTANSPDTKNPKYVTHIEVADWKRAICEIELTRFAFHNRTMLDGLYKLSPKEIKQFQKYTNTYDRERADEYRKMYNSARRKRK